MAATEILKTRVTPETKARVAEITRCELLTEAVWLRRIVARELRENDTISIPHEAAARQAGADLLRRGPCSKNLGPASRLYVRMRREDHLLLHERAEARGMASATYISVLVRSHLRALTPLPKDELAHSSKLWVSSGPSAATSTRSPARPIRARGSPLLAALNSKLS